jgi:NAD(P)-dependent dehydrogenase (short-subunit alcohol dehydrogenase family)
VRPVGRCGNPTYIHRTCEGLRSGRRARQRGWYQPSGVGRQQRAAAIPLATDLTGVYATILAAYPLLKAAGSSSIINITSINSVRGFPGNPGYVAAKAGLAGLTRALAVDYASDGVRVNALAPGYVATDMTATSFADPAMHEDRRRHTALGRWGNPDDMVGAAVFLASAASGYMTGQELFVDGGWTTKGLAISPDKKS